MRPSAGRFRPFSSARAFDPGMNKRLRRGRIMALFPSNFEPARKTRFDVVKADLAAAYYLSMISGQFVPRKNRCPFFRFML
jgi:hypothetical protein